MHEAIGNRCEDQATEPGGDHANVRRDVFSSTIDDQANDAQHPEDCHQGAKVFFPTEDVAKIGEGRLLELVAGCKGSRRPKGP